MLTTVVEWENKRMINITNVTKFFSDVCSLKDVNAKLPSGSIFGLIGSNGSGKSTLLRVISGIYTPDNGSVDIDEIPVWENEKIKEKIVYLSDEPYFIPGATITEMKEMYRSIYPKFDVELYEKLVSLLGLPLKRKITGFSKGMQKQTSVLLGLSSKPEYLLCDETFDGLDPVMRQVIKRVIADEVIDSNLTVIIASHNLRELEDICDHIGMLHKGEMLFVRELDDMRENIYKIQAVFPSGIKREDLPEGSVISFSNQGSLYTIVLRGNREEALRLIGGLSPVFSEVIPLTLEEVFITEMEERGYDYSSILV